MWCWRSAPASACSRSTSQNASRGLLRSSSTLDWNSPSFRQDSSFYYLTGLPNAQRAVLVLEGPTKQAWLFVSPAPDSTPFVPHLKGREASFLTANDETARMLRIEHVLPLQQLDGFLSVRRTLRLYLDVGSTIGSLPGTDEAHAADRKAARDRWPDTRIEDGTPVLQSVRAVKIAEEIASLEKAARITEAAFSAGVAATLTEADVGTRGRILSGDRLAKIAERVGLAISA